MFASVYPIPLKIRHSEQDKSSNFKNLPTMIDTKHTIRSLFLTTNSEIYAIKSYPIVSESPITI